MTSREGATLIILGAFMIWALARREIRTSAGEIIRQFAQLTIALPLLALFASVAVAVAVSAAHRTGFWTFDLTTATFLWCVFIGFGWFMGIADAGKQSGFVKHRVREAVGVSAVFEFFLNIETFPLWIEVIGQTVIILLVMLDLVARHQKDAAAVAELTSGLLSIIGLSLILLTVRNILRDWDALDPHALLNELLLPNLANTRCHSEHLRDCSLRRMRADLHPRQVQEQRGTAAAGRDLRPNRWVARIADGSERILRILGSSSRRTR